MRRPSARRTDEALAVTARAWDAFDQVCPAAPTDHPQQGAGPLAGTAAQRPLRPRRPPGPAGPAAVDPGRGRPQAPALSLLPAASRLPSPLQALPRRTGAPPAPASHPVRAALAAAGAQGTGRLPPAGQPDRDVQRGAWRDAFCSLRSILRLQDQPEKPRGPLTPRPPPLGDPAQLRQYHEGLRQQSESQAARGPESPRPEAIILRYLDRYGDGLAGHPVVRDAAGRAVAVVDRTNNVIEQAFAITKQGLRRRLGRAHLGRDLENQPAQAMLAQNLRHPDYVRVLCGTLNQLPQAFAALDRRQRIGPPRLERTNRDAKLRSRNRAWAREAQLDPPPPPMPNTSLSLGTTSL